MSNGGGQQEDKNANAILWGVFGVFFLAAVIWYFFSYELKLAFLAIRRAELAFLDFFFDLVLEYSTVSQYYDFVNTLTVSHLSMDVAKQISNFVGNYLRWPFSACFLIYAYIMMQTNIKSKYQKKYDMKKLKEQEKDLWPQIKPISREDLVKADLDTGPWAMALPPIIFCNRHKLLEVKLHPSAGQLLYKGPEFKATLLKKRAERVFAKQLGKPWEGVDKMPIHRRALFAAFIAKGCRDSQAGIDILSQLANSAASGVLDCSGVDALWQKHIEKNEVQKIYHSHAFETTLMASILELAREDGVLPCSDFIWLKAVDRVLWYTLSDVGRQTAFCESAGTFAHRKVELALKRPVKLPMINEAIKALEEVIIKDLIYTPEPEEAERIRKQALEEKGIQVE